jgi:hypothetical protein
VRVAVIAVIKTIALTLARDVREISQFAVWTNQALGVSVELDRVLVLPHIMSIINFLESAFQATHAAGQTAAGVLPSLPEMHRHIGRKH